MRRLAVVFIACAAAIGSIAGFWSAPVSASSAEDGERLDRAIEAFNDRMTEADWTSLGSMESLGDDAAGPTDAASEVLLPADEARLRECAGDVIALFPGEELDGFPGQRAISVSDVFASGSGAPSGEVAAAIVVSVDDANVATATRIVEEFGSQQTADCLGEAVAESDAFAEAPFDTEFDVVATDDLGIGDTSAALRLEVAVGLGGSSTTLGGASFVWAQVGNDLAGIIHAGLSIMGADSSTEFDAREELERVVESLGG